MGRFRKSFTVKLDIKTKEIRHSETKFPELKIQSGIFSDTRHYAKNITAQGLYSILLYGTKDGRIPGRNVLDFANKYIEDNKERFVEVYLKNKDDIQNAGQIIGTDINNKHKMTTNIKKVLVLGSGALKIGEAGGFDYSGSQILHL